MCRLAKPPATTLIQLSGLRARRHLSAEWRHLILSVEAAPDHARLQVRDSASQRMLYAGQRINPALAQAAAIEFAAFQFGENPIASAKSLARDLTWRECQAPSPAH